MSESKLNEKYMGHKKLSTELGKKGAKDPEALAAWIGRQKYGKAKFQKAAAAGKKLGEEYHMNEGVGNFAKAILSLDGWARDESDDPDFEETFYYDDAEGGYYADGVVRHNLETGKVYIDFEDKSGDYGGDIKGTFDSIGDAMDVLRDRFSKKHGSSKPSSLDSLGGRELAGSSDVYKTDKIGKKGTLTKSRADAMKAGSEYRMRGGPKGVLPEEQGVAEGSEKQYSVKHDHPTNRNKYAFSTISAPNIETAKKLANEKFSGVVSVRPLIKQQFAMEGVAEGSEVPAKVGFNDIVVKKQPDGKYKIVRKGGAWMRLAKGEILTAKDIKALKANRAIFHVEQGVAEGVDQETLDRMSKKYNELGTTPVYNMSKNQRYEHSRAGFDYAMFLRQANANEPSADVMSKWSLDFISGFQQGWGAPSREISRAMQNIVDYRKEQGVAETKVSNYKDMGATSDTTHFIKNVTTGKIVSPHRSRQDAEDALIANKRGSKHEFKIVRARKEGVAEDSLNEFYDEKNNFGGDGDGQQPPHDPRNSMAFKAGWKAGQEISNEIPLQQVLQNIKYPDELMAKFMSGFIEGRKAKIKWLKSQGRKATLRQNGSIKVLESEVEEQGVAEDRVDEKLTKSMSAGEIISDFVGSDDPKFKGKTKKERTKMALGAYYGMHPEKSKKKADEAKDPQMEAWARELDTLLNEGLTLTTSTGQPGGSDSVSVSATDEDAKTLMKLIQDAGLMRAQTGSMSAPANDKPAITVEPVSHDAVMGTLEPEDDGEEAMGFLKRMLGARGEHGGHDHGDFEKEESGEECGECGHADCQCDHEEVAEMDNYEETQHSSSDHNMSPIPEELEGGQKELDKAPPFGKLTGADFKALRAEKDKEETDESALDQPATMESGQAGEQDLAAAEEESANELAAAETEEETAMSEGGDICNECGGTMEEGHSCSEEKLDEWANSRGGKSTDEAFLADIAYMTKTLSGGLNGIKQDQTTLPSTRVKSEERNVGSSMAELLRKLQNIN